jgi:hypothetical protein
MQNYKVVITIEPMAEETGPKVYVGSKMYRTDAIFQTESMSTLIELSEKFLASVIQTSPTPFEEAIKRLYKSLTE